MGAQGGRWRPKRARDRGGPRGPSVLLCRGQSDPRRRKGASWCRRPRGLFLAYNGLGEKWGWVCQILGASAPPLVSLIAFMAATASARRGRREVLTPVLCFANRVGLTRMSDASPKIRLVGEQRLLGGIVGQAGGSTLTLGARAYYISVHDFARLSDAFVVMVNQHSQRCEDWMIRR
jgi:hypothetical protein